jgi:hypothetical protein
VDVTLLAAGALVVAGGIACVTGRRAAVVALGVAVMLAASALLTDPFPMQTLLAERAVGAILAAELLWLGLRGRMVAGASALGWLPLALLAAAAFAAGVAAARLVPGSGPVEALGAALALFTVGVIAVAGRSDGIHLGLSALVLVTATSVVRLALSGPASSLETLLVAGVGVAIAGAVALIVPQPEAEIPWVGSRAPARSGSADAPTRSFGRR